jgi:hypothetical protein
MMSNARKWWRGKKSTPFCWLFVCLCCCCTIWCILLTLLLSKVCLYRLWLCVEWRGENVCSVFIYRVNTHVFDSIWDDILLIFFLFLLPAESSSSSSSQYDTKQSRELAVYIAQWKEETTQRIFFFFFIFSSLFGPARLMLTSEQQ